MIQKSKYRLLCTLFRLLAYLSDRTNGAALFVRPKLVIGGVIVGLGLTFPEKAIAQKPNENIPTPKQASTNDSSNVRNETQEPFCYVWEEMPEYPGGTDEMMQFIAKNQHYPQKLEKKGIVGMVICSFIVNKDGSISDIRIVRGLHPLLDEEAIRIIKLFPNWKPGKQGANSVPVRFTLPIRFTLPNKKK